MFKLKILWCFSESQHHAEKIIVFKNFNLKGNCTGLVEDFSTAFPTKMSPRGKLSAAADEQFNL